MWSWITYTEVETGPYFMLIETTFEELILSKVVTPLFLSLQIVEYLIEVCGANVEQRGLYEVPDDRTVHKVTPLWCASVAGMFKVGSQNTIFS